MTSTGVTRTTIATRTIARETSARLFTMRDGRTSGDSWSAVGDWGGSDDDGGGRDTGAWCASRGTVGGRAVDTDAAGSRTSGGAVSASAVLSLSSPSCSISVVSSGRIAVSLRQVRQSMAGGQSDAPRRPVSTVGGTAYALSRALGHSGPTHPAYWFRCRAVEPPYRLHSRGRTLRHHSQSPQQIV